MAVNPAAIIIDDGSLSTGGFLFKNGKNIFVPFKDSEGNRSILVQSMATFELDGKAGG